jgi:hypothetical protein
MDTSLEAFRQNKIGKPYDLKHSVLSFPEKLHLLSKVDIAKTHRALTQLEISFVMTIVLLPIEFYTRPEIHSYWKAANIEW